jgi:hypothetical protein
MAKNHSTTKGNRRHSLDKQFALSSREFRLENIFGGLCISLLSENSVHAFATGKTAYKPAVGNLSKYGNLVG